MEPPQELHNNLTSSFSRKSSIYIDSFLPQDSVGEVDEKDGFRNATAPADLSEEPGWYDLSTNEKATKVITRLLDQDSSGLTEAVFQQKYGSAISDCFEEWSSTDETFIYFLLRKWEPEDLEKSESWKRLVVTTLSILHGRFGNKALSRPAVLWQAISNKHIGFIKFLCDRAKDEQIRDIIGTAIAADENPSQDCLLFAIRSKVPLDILDQLITYAREESFSLPTEANGNTLLHHFVMFTENHLSVPDRRCVVENCIPCRQVAKYHDMITDERQYTARFLKTLQKIIDRFPKALWTLNKAGKTPFQVHIEGREEKFKGAEYLPELEIPPPESTSAAETVTLTTNIQSNSGVLTPDHIEKSTGLSDKIPKQATHDDKRSKKPNRSEKLSGNKPSLPPNRGKSSHLQLKWKDSDHLVREVGRKLLEQCSSRDNFNHAASSIFGDQETAPSRDHRLQTAFKMEDVLFEDLSTDYKFLKFNSILACVELTMNNQPELELQRGVGTNHHGTNRMTTDPLESMTPEIQQDLNANRLISVLRWLRDEQEVQRILKLVIKDDQENQCKDETVEECLKGWDIRYLDWNKQNVSLETIAKGGAKKLVELWLTWNGANSCLIGWSDHELGLQKLLPDLRLVHIRVESTAESASRLNEYLRAFETRIATRFPDLKLDCPDEGQLRLLTKKRDKSSGGRGRTDGQDESKLQHKWIRAVSEFTMDLTTKYHNIQKNNPIHIRLNKNPVRVAVIDDGITASRLRRKGSLIDGWPHPRYSDHGNLKTFYSSTENHGTVMANLILFVCPWADLYAAKLESLTNDDKCMAQRATEAVRWAMSRKVDIISMSWTFKDHPQHHHWKEKLKTALSDAVTEGIILFCSFDDKGMYDDKSLPASFDLTGLTKIGSCDEYGNRSDFVNKDRVHYLFPGEKLGQTLVNILQDWNIKDKGSSASTALASGLAALILWCAEWCGDDRRIFHNERMNTLFGKLKISVPAGGASLVDVTKLLNDAKASDAPVDTFLGRLKEKIVDEIRTFNATKQPST